MTAQSPPIPDTNSEEFRASPEGHIYGIVDEPLTAIPAAVAGLLATGVPIDGIHVYCCAAGARALDPTGETGNWRERLSRSVHAFRYSNDHQQLILDELEAGHGLIGVAVDDDDRVAITAVLAENGAHDIIHYGKYTWTYMTDPGAEGQPISTD